MSPLETRRSLCCGPSLCPSLPSVVWWGRWRSRSSSKPWAGETQAQNIHQLWAFSVCVCACALEGFILVSVCVISLSYFSSEVIEMSLYFFQLELHESLIRLTHKRGICCCRIFSRLLKLFVFFFNCETTACRHLVDQLITAKKFKVQTAFLPLIYV